MSPTLPVDYPRFLQELKARIQQAQTRAALAANRELLELYWSIGRDIVLRQEWAAWGSAVIDRLGQDLQTALPGLQGFSGRNLWRMRAFFLAYRAEGTEKEGDAILPQAVAEIPWGHHALLLDKVKDRDERIFYARAALTNGWSRNVLTVQIEAQLARRQGKALTNFQATLPPPQSDLAQQSLKDPYLFDFLTLDAEAREKDIEGGLVEHVQRFLLELGIGFAFVGRQVPILVGSRERYLDLLFYHLKLRCFVVIELKSVPFEPEFAGKLNFYLSAVDSQLRHPEDRPSIGLLLCKEKERVVVEYALRDIGKPIGIAEWRTKLVGSLPAELQANLPTIEEIEKELGEIPGEEGKQ